MRRVLMVTTVASTLRSFLLPHAAYWRSQGWRVDAAASGVSGSSECREAFDRVWDVQWSRNPWDVVGILNAQKAIEKLVRTEGYDLVHVHTPIASFVSRLAVRRLRREGRPRVVYTAHGFHFYKGGSVIKNALFLCLEKLAGRWTDRLIVINKEDYQAAIHYRIVGPDRVSHVPGIGIDLSLYDTNKCSSASIQALRNELHLLPSSNLFTMIAEGNPGKRHCDLVTALHLLRRSDVHAAFAGTGPEMERVQEQAHKLGLSEQVHVLGYRSDIPTLICASVATVLPSQREGLPRSVMESLSLERPVIGADTRGVRDLLEDGSGWIFPVGDTAALAACMRHVLDHPEKAERSGQMGRKKMKGYDMDTVLRHVHLLYDEMLT